MLSAIFLGIFGMWMGLLSLIHSRRDGRERMERVPVATPKLAELKVVVEKKVEPSAAKTARSELGSAFRDLWHEIVRGA